MNARTILNIGLKKGLLSAGLTLTSGIAFGTIALADTAATPPANAPTIAPLRDGSNPAVVAADEKVHDTKSKLEQAHKQLNAAKAMLKAAEAEYKAACADKDALALRNEAQRLADASSDPIATPSTPATSAIPDSSNTNTSALDLSNSRIEGFVPPAVAPAYPAPAATSAPVPPANQPASIP